MTLSLYTFADETFVPGIAGSSIPCAGSAYLLRQSRRDHRIVIKRGIVGSVSHNKDGWNDRVGTTTMLGSLLANYRSYGDR